MSGGTENTRYYVSGLVKDDAGIALETGYQKQSLRSNLDQELGSGFQLQVNVDGTHSTSDRGLSNNDNSGTSPYVAFSGYPELHQPSAGQWHSGRPAGRRLPDQHLRSAAIRSRPSTFSRTKKMSGGSWVPRRSGGLRVRSAKSTLQFIGIGGVDYFQQDNNLVSPPELQFEDDDGQPGTVVVEQIVEPEPERRTQSESHL